jgi:hypothetical protein
MAKLQPEKSYEPKHTKLPKTLSFLKPVVEKAI